ncbi:hypothetical protein [Streptacidiphilus sp. PAMC 29251]
MTATGLVTAQREVDGRTNEFTVFRPMLAEFDLTDTVVTFDALHSQTLAGRAAAGQDPHHRARPG